jgi:hypothetical protein
MGRNRPGASASKVFSDVRDVGPVFTRRKDGGYAWVYVNSKLAKPSTWQALLPRGCRASVSRTSVGRYST